MPESPIQVSIIIPLMKFFNSLMTFMPPLVLLKRCQPYQRSPLTKLSQLFHMPIKKSLVSVAVVAAAVAVGGVVVEVVADVEDKMVAEADPHSRTTPVQTTPTPTKINPSSVDPSTRTCRPESGRGVGCTIAGVVRLISVQNQLHARGRMSSQPSLQNEIQTSSAKIKR